MGILRRRQVGDSGRSPRGPARDIRGNIGPGRPRQNHCLAPPRAGPARARRPGDATHFTPRRVIASGRRLSVSGRRGRQLHRIGAGGGAREAAVGSRPVRRGGAADPAKSLKEITNFRILPIRPGRARDDRELSRGGGTKAAYPAVRHVTWPRSILGRNRSADDISRGCRCGRGCTRWLGRRREGHGQRQGSRDAGAVSQRSLLRGRPPVVRDHARRSGDRALHVA